MRSARTRLVVAAATLLVALACDTSGNAYLDDNHALADSLPVYPGATKTERHDAERTVDESTAGWTTRTVYSTPTGTTAAAVLTFYRNALGDWTADTECCEGLDVQEFRRGTEQVTVNADNAPTSYEITVDARATS